MKTRVITLSDISRHPRGSLHPHDYIYEVGETVVFDEGDHIVVRQDENDLWLARIDYVPGTKTIFSCTAPQGPTTIFDVKRPRRTR